MKQSYLFSSVLAVLLTVLFLSSCSPNGNLTIEKRVYGKGYYVHRSGKPDTKAVANADRKENETEAVRENPAAVAGIETSPVNSLEQIAAPAGPIVRAATATKNNVPAKQNKIAEAPLKKAKEKINPVKRKIQSIAKKPGAAAPAGDTETILLVILALLLSPLAVFLKEGVTNRFWIDLICFLLGGGITFGLAFYGGFLLLFAIVFALLIVLDVI